MQDDAGIFVPRDAAAGAYQFAVVVYNSATGQDLTPSTSALRVEGYQLILDEEIIVQ